MKLNGFARKILNLFCLSLVFSLCFLSAHGYCMTQNETKESITIPITQLQRWKNELILLQTDLIECKSELQKAKKPSAELQNQLKTAEEKLKALQNQLAEQKQDLTMLSNEAAGLRTNLQTLKQNIDKERRVHKRQIWQNRIWTFIVGTGIGFAIHK